MPVYDYLCNKCGHTFEERHRIDERKKPSEEPCSKCGEYGIRLIISAKFEMLAPDQLGRVKPPEDWRNFLGKLKKDNPGSDFNTY